MDSSKSKFIFEFCIDLCLFTFIGLSSAYFAVCYGNQLSHWNCALYRQFCPYWRVLNRHASWVHISTPTSVSMVGAAQSSYCSSSKI